MRTQDHASEAQFDDDDRDDDDRPIGRVLTRREVLILAGSISGTAFIAACAPGALSPSPAATATASAGTPTAGPTATAAASTALPSCIVRPEATEGPFFVDELLDRSDIRSDPSDGSLRAGTPLILRFLVSRLDGTTCVPYEGAAVDVWHCDAEGAYSDVAQNGTAGQKFLRGYQLTDASGMATFTTIYPGWYQGRAVHIHFKIRTEPGASSGFEFTSQLFFDDDLSDEVFAAEPYASNGERDQRNDTDSIYGETGDLLLLAVSAEGEGYATLFDIGLQVS